MVVEKKNCKNKHKKQGRRKKKQLQSGLIERQKTGQNEIRSRNYLKASQVFQLSLQKTIYSLPTGAQWRQTMIHPE